MAFRINYSKVISQADSISNNARDLSAQIKLLSQLEQDCRVAWKGEAANVFLAKLTELKDNMNQTCSQMSVLASTIKYCAEQIRRADESANNTAASLHVGH